MVAGAAGVVPAVSTLAWEGATTALLSAGVWAGALVVGALAVSVGRCSRAIGGRGRGAGILRHVLAVGVAAVQLCGRLIGHSRNLFLLRLMVLQAPPGAAQTDNHKQHQPGGAHQPAVALLRRLPKRNSALARLSPRGWAPAWPSSAAARLLEYVRGERRSGYPRRKVEARSAGGLIVFNITNRGHLQA